MLANLVILNLITGIICDGIQAAKEADEQEAMLRDQLNRTKEHAELLEMFERADPGRESDDGCMRESDERGDGGAGCTRLPLLPEPRRTVGPPSKFSQR